MTHHHPGFTHRFAATELDTRHALSSIMARLRQIGLPDEQAGSIEIALAEVVNNIVEHAYANIDKGEVLIRAVVGPGDIRVLLVDWGPPLPGAVCQIAARQALVRKPPICPKAALAGF